MTNRKQPYTNPSLAMILEQQPQLYDLHTHLLGMGNAGFWIDSILLDTNIMPANDTFLDNSTVRRDLPRLIWDQESNTGFVNGDIAAEFIDYLIECDVLPSDNLQETIKQLEVAFPYYSQTFCNIIDNEELNGELHGRNLRFKYNFSYDVVLKLSDLGNGLGVKEADSYDLIQIALVEKLGAYLSEPPIFFRHWIIFNARKQVFEVVYGIQVEELRQLITIDPDAPNEAKKLARAHIVNAFSMCDAQGSPARSVDFHNFRGSFTPDFYPRRFALKDSIYEQRLDVLAALINHVLKRYQVCLPPVLYCEFSIGVSDLTSPWIFDVLSSFPAQQLEKDKLTIETSETTMITQRTTTNLMASTTPGIANYTYRATKNSSSFTQCILDNHFPYLKVACVAYNMNSSGTPSIPNVTYKFLAGFNRQFVRSPLPNNQKEALRLLLDDSPRAIQLMLQEIVDSEKQDRPSQAFGRLIDQLKTLEKTGEKIPWFYDWVVGIDLFGDELGYPYCPFVARPFIEYVDKQRKEKNSCFGMCIHCGENVPFADADSAIYRLFVGHMYIVFRCLLFLQHKLKYGIRIAHGVGFERVLDTSMKRPKHRKSSILLAEMRHYCEHLLKTIAFEVNITSNEYLIGNSLRGRDRAKKHCLDALIALQAPIIFATDNDGIWPIDHCSSVHPGHHSLAAEYCRAISTRLIRSTDQLHSILEASKNFCFFNMGGHMPTIDNTLWLDDTCTSTLIVHPDIIKLILVQCIKENLTSGPFYKHYFKIYSNNYSTFEDGEDVLWDNKYKSLARVAYVCLHTDNKVNYSEQTCDIPLEYHQIFNDDMDGSKFNFIHDNWSRIREAFILPSDGIDCSQQIRYVLMTDEKQSFYSTPSNNEQDPTHLINYLNNNSYRRLEIHAFTGSTNIAETVPTINDKLTEASGYKDISVLMYTNNDKTRYTYYKTGHRVKRFQMNSGPVQHNNTKENFFYVLCAHVRAATTALHIIAKMISEPVTSTQSTTIALLQPRFDCNVNANPQIPYTTTERAETPPPEMVVDAEYCTEPTS